MQTSEESARKLLSYIEKIKPMSGSALFDELIISSHRKQVIVEIKRKAGLVKMSPRKWMALELQREVINKSNFKNQEDLYDVLNLKESTKVK
jgi:hypothetical protein